MNEKRHFLCVWMFLIMLSVLPVLAQDVLVPGCDWQEGQPHVMQWPQLPDLTPLGMNVDVSLGLADDFLCTQSGPITDIHLWGGFERSQGPGQNGEIIFELSLYSDTPSADNPLSGPGSLLWTQTFYPGHYSARQLRTVM